MNRHTFSVRLKGMLEIIFGENKEEPNLVCVMIDMTVKGVLVSKAFVTKRALESPVLLYLC